MMEDNINKPDKLEVWDEAKLRLSFSNGPLLVNTEGNHYKFWYYDKKEQKVYWGRIGNKIRSQDVSDRGYSYSRDKVKEKTNKGYRKLK